jgi:diacylglycerol O-acyltransferase
MSATDRLTALDASFLDLEGQSAHMHVAAVMLFEGEPPAYEELLEALERRLHLVPRYRQKLAFPPGRVARPRWVDDPHLNLSYHVRATALPSPGSEDQLRALAGRVFSQQLDRDKPLWEMWLAGGLEPEPGGDGRRRFALLSKTHHALVDGVSGVDIASVLFDLDPEPPGPLTPPERWLPRPEPSGAQLLAEVVRERAGIPLALARDAATRLQRPDEVVGELREMLAGLGAILGARIDAAPPSPYNERIGPHRRFTWVRAVLDDVKAIKNALGGTVNDVVLATVAASR